MPYFSAVCGVSPNCANTGMPARASARTASGKSAAPSSLIMSAPPSLTRRMAARTALSVPSCSGPNGKSQLTSARVTPRRTALQHDQHLVDRDFERIGVAPQIDADGIADRDEIHAGAVGDPRDLVVPGDDADALLPVALHLLQRGNGDLCFHRAPLAVVIPGSLASARDPE